MSLHFPINESKPQMAAAHCVVYWYLIHKDILLSARKSFSSPTSSHFLDKLKVRPLKKANVPHLGAFSSDGTYSIQFLSLLKKSWALPSSVWSHIFSWTEGKPWITSQIWCLEGVAHRVPRFVSKWGPDIFHPSAWEKDAIIWHTFTGHEITAWLWHFRSDPLHR